MLVSIGIKQNKMALPNYKDIVELIKKGATLEAQEIIMERREVFLELQEENLILREEIKTLKENIQLKEELDFDGKVYWRISKGEKIGPFCQKCFDYEGKLIRLQSDGEYRDCNVCHCVYSV